MTLEHPAWTPPRYPVETARPALWSPRRTAVAIVAAVGIGSLTAVTVSYADTGAGRTGQFQGPGGGRFNGGSLGNGQLGNGQFGPPGAGQQGGPLQGGQLGPAPGALPGAR